MGPGFGRGGGFRAGFHVESGSLAQPEPFSVEALWQATPAAGLEMIRTGWPNTGDYHLSLEA